MSVPISVLNGIDTSVVTHTKIVTEAHEFSELATIWEVLQKRSGSSSVYLSFDWLYTWWQRFGDRGDYRLSVLCVYCEGLLIAIAPFYIEKKAIYPLGFKHTLRMMGQNDSLSDAEQLDIIIDRRFDYYDLVVHSITEFFITSRRFSSLVVNGLTHGSLLYKLIRQLPKSKFIAIDSNKQSSTIPLPATFDLFVANQGNTWQSRYRGHKKIMTMSGNVEIRVSNTPDNIQAGLQSLAQIMCAKQRKIADGNCSFDTENYMRFHEDICHLLSIHANVDIISLIMDGRLLASACCYHNNQTTQVYQMASVKGDGVHFSPIFMLIGEIVKLAIEKGKERVDFHSNHTCSEFELDNMKADKSLLYGLKWQKSWSRLYLIKSARKLCNALGSTVAY